MISREIHYQFYLGFRDIARVNAANPNALLVDMEHDLHGLFALFSEIGRHYKYSSKSLGRRVDPPFSPDNVASTPPSGSLKTQTGIGVKIAVNPIIPSRCADSIVDRRLTGCYLRPDFWSLPCCSLPPTTS